MKKLMLLSALILGFTLSHAELTSEQQEVCNLIESTPIYPQVLEELAHKIPTEFGAFSEQDLKAIEQNFSDYLYGPDSDLKKKYHNYKNYLKCLNIRIILGDETAKEDKGFLLKEIDKKHFDLLKAYNERKENNPTSPWGEVSENEKNQAAEEFFLYSRYMALDSAYELDAYAIMLETGYLQEGWPAHSFQNPEKAERVREKKSLLFPDLEG